MGKLEDKIIELKSLITDFDTNYFLGHIAFTLTRIAERETSPLFTNLRSPQMQLFYLASLHLATEGDGTKKVPNKQEWDKMTTLLKEIEDDYMAGVINGRSPEELCEEERKKIAVAMPTFMSYFFNGSLSYTEQLIERIEQTFKKYEKQIIEEFNLRLNDFIECFDFVGNEINSKLNLYMDVNNDEWIKFTTLMTKKGLNDPHQWFDHIPENFRKHFEFLENSGKIFEFDLNNLTLEYDKEKLKSFFDPLSSSKAIKSDILYYTSELPLNQKPVYKVDDDNYFVFHHNQILTGIYELLYAFCDQISLGKVHKERDKLLEKKTFEIFKEFFPQNETAFYQSYNLDGRSEQDLLIVHKGLVLIIEVKSAWNREPMRDPLKAYDKIKGDFRNSIQYGYTQCLRIEDAIEDNNIIELLDSRKKKIGTLHTKKIHNVFSIIVTSDRFGVVQNDLSHLLEIEADVPYPWAVNVDDLEVFFLMLRKRKGRIRDLISFLTNRELLHGRFLVDDELDTCAMFYSKPQDFIKACQTTNDTLVHIAPNLTGIVEEMYFSKNGLGFKNERFLEEKNDDTVLNISAPRKTPNIRMREMGPNDLP